MTANAAGEIPPEVPDEDVHLPFKSCMRRIGRWVLEEAGIAYLPVEPYAQCPPEPPWCQLPTSTTIYIDLPTQTRKSDPPERRRRAAEQALAVLPEPDCTIWSDGSAAGGTTRGGGGALITLHREGRSFECTRAAGSSCSSTRAELVAVHSALLAVLDLPPDSLEQIRELRLCTDSRACLQILQRGASEQMEALPGAIWVSLRDRTDEAPTSPFNGYQGMQGSLEMKRRTGLQIRPLFFHRRPRLSTTPAQRPPSGNKSTAGEKRDHGPTPISFQPLATTI